MKKKTTQKSTKRRPARKAKKPKTGGKAKTPPKKAKLRKVQTATDHSFIFAKGKPKKSTAKDNRELAKAKANTRHAVREHRSTDPTQIYLRELGYQTLLTAKEELQKTPPNHKNT